jgi:hypothetical protein
MKYHLISSLNLNIILLERIHALYKFQVVIGSNLAIIENLSSNLAVMENLGSNSTVMGNLGNNLIITQQ